MLHDVLKFASDKAGDSQIVALITVTGVEGSSPSSVGQMMAVASDGAVNGTIGGGESEHQVIKLANKAIESGDSFFSFSFDHTEIGMTCGGKMAGFGNILGGQNRLVIFGGGHISQCLARVAALTGFTITVVEDRAEFADAFDGVKNIVCKPDEYEATIPVSSSDYIVICTRGHATDADALRFCLTKNPKYIGMIGSARKVAALFNQMTDEGVPRELLDRVFSPVGLDIASEVPSEIAVAVLAEVLLIKNNGSLRHKRGVPGQ